MPSVTQHELRWLPPDTERAARERMRRSGFAVHPLRRRDQALGFLAERGRPEQPEPLEPLWSTARPIHLPGVLAAGIEAFADEIAASHEMFLRLAGGARFLDELATRLSEQELFVPAGSTFDRADEREIEKVWVHGVVDGEIAARDVWAKASWITADERDASLRVRFSCGVEQLDEWQELSELAPWADAYAEIVFPECATIAGHEPLIEAIGELCGGAVRLSERIVYANAPNGGAAFHADADPTQRGVVFGQFLGATAWFALPKRELAALVVERAHAIGAGALVERLGDVDAALARLGDDDDVELWRLLNADPATIGQLVAQGHAMVVAAGDALLLPTHGPDESCWHSVVALGREPSLAHSYGVFRAE
jgi:hypothetical protein